MTDENEALLNEIRKLLDEYQNLDGDGEDSNRAIEYRLNRLENWGRQAHGILSSLIPWARSVNDNIQYLRSKVGS